MQQQQQQQTGREAHGGEQSALKSAAARVAACERAGTRGATRRGACACPLTIGMFASCRVCVACVSVASCEGAGRWGGAGGAARAAPVSETTFPALLHARLQATSTARPPACLPAHPPPPHTDIDTARTGQRVCTRVPRRHAAPDESESPPSGSSQPRRLQPRRCQRALGDQPHRRSCIAMRTHDRDVGQRVLCRRILFHSARSSSVVVGRRVVFVASSGRSFDLEGGPQPAAHRARRPAAAAGDHQEGQTGANRTERDEREGDVLLLVLWFGVAVPLPIGSDCPGSAGVVLPVIWSPSASRATQLQTSSAAGTHDQRNTELSSTMRLLIADRWPPIPPCLHDSHAFSAPLLLLLFSVSSRLAASVAVSAVVGVRPLARVTRVRASERVSANAVSRAAPLLSGAERRSSASPTRSDTGRCSRRSRSPRFRRSSSW